MFIEGVGEVVGLKSEREACKCHNVRVPDVEDDVEG